MKIRNFLFITAVVLPFTACETAYMNPAPGTDNLSVFNEYANICIEKYGLSEVKGVDLVALSDSLRPYITEDLSQEELYDYMNIITKRMKEGHTYLSAPAIGKNQFAAWAWNEGYEKAYESSITEAYYYGTDANPDAQVIKPEGSFWEMEYGLLPQYQDIGYIRLSTFAITINDDQLETMMEYLQNTKGIIIDVRSNFGGFVEFAARLASYFTEEEYIFAKDYIKTGPAPDDFVISEMRITPSGSPFTYTKPVMVIHDRITFSSGSIFTVMMYPLDHVTTVGQTFGGGTGQIVDGILSNGWQYELSTSNLVDWLDRPTDPGIVPDIPVELDLSDTLRDEIIERAVLEINNGPAL